MGHNTLFGKIVLTESKQDLCGFWKSYARIHVGNETFAAISKEFLCDKEASIAHSFQELERIVRENAQGVMVGYAQQNLLHQIHRQNLVSELING